MQPLLPAVSADGETALTLVMDNKLEQLAIKLNYSFEEITDFLTH